MEIVLRQRHHKHNDDGIDLRETEVGLVALDSAVAGILAVALAGGAFMGGYDLSQLLEQLSGKVDIAASATVKSPVRRRHDFDALAAHFRDFASVADLDPQQGVEDEEVTGEDILALVDQHGGVAVVERDPDTGVIDSITASFTEYDPAEMQEVLESLHATGSVSPSKIVGDLAQTSITTANGQEQIISLAEWTISWKRKTVDATTTDDSLYESSLGSSKSWTSKAKFMFVDGDQSQVDGVLSAIDTTSVGSLTWNFFPTVATGRAAFSGLAYIDGIDIGSGSGKIVGLDVSLKGTGPLHRLTQAVPVANANTTTGIQGQV